MTPLQRAAAFVTFVIRDCGVPPAGHSPQGPAARIEAATLLHVAPAVRRIILTARQARHSAGVAAAWWIGDRGQGSCVHAALVHLWHWQGRHEFARAWAARHGNGETAEGLAGETRRGGRASFAAKRAVATRRFWNGRFARGAARRSSSRTGRTW